MRNAQRKVSIRVFVPVIPGDTENDVCHATFQQWVCEQFQGFTVIPGELIRGAWCDPATGNVMHDNMGVYHIWLDIGPAYAIESDCRLIADKVMALFGEKAVSIIRDTTITPIIFS